MEHKGKRQAKRGTQHIKAVNGFTLVEVVVSLSILALVLQGVMLGYISSTKRAEWSARSLAAQSMASEAVEQKRSAKWDTQANVDQLQPQTNTTVCVLNLPMGNTNLSVLATNTLTISKVSDNPPLKQIRDDCVWSFVNQIAYTNTVVLLRAPDQ